MARKQCISGAFLWLLSFFTYLTGTAAMLSTTDCGEGHGRAHALPAEVQSSVSGCACIEMSRSRAEKDLCLKPSRGTARQGSCTGVDRPAVWEQGSFPQPPPHLLKQANALDHRPISLFTTRAFQSVELAKWTERFLLRNLLIPTDLECFSLISLIIWVVRCVLMYALF